MTVEKIYMHRTVINILPGKPKKKNIHFYHVFCSSINVVAGEW